MRGNIKLMGGPPSPPLGKTLEHDTTNRCINTSHIVKIKFRLQCDLIAGRLFGHYTDGGVYILAFFSKNLFVQFRSFVSRVKLRVLEECCICQITESLAIVITQETQVKSSYCFMYRAKTMSQNFSMTHGIAWK